MSEAEERKAVSWKFEGSKLIVEVDLNKDGESVVKLELNIEEIPDEVLDAIKG